MAKEITDIIVEGMSCTHCVNSIKNAVGSLNGVQKVDVDLATKKVTVEFDPEVVKGKQIKDAIEDQGYDVTMEHTNFV
ncbi:copper chaperone CopZ [Ruminiclostridium cellulolyticum]|uniref:Copper chaperone CopZ n=1 Tax=Ruminiclostridium cellulolyticum (strain ATCC 35319 / DSM 5812 / JCM 6584 / H10) TaxID=394503 RepID=B8I2S3_RUMCH|nr:copper chaperone CopZ [Ruminiclostridium cellulolyticum]ACL76066.1 copper ion binding protein [Ruminiclostridium cellulolyticum H10]